MPIRLFFFFSLLPFFGIAQSVPQDNFQLHIKRTNSQIQLDGHLKELVWTEAEKAIAFWEKSPVVQPHVSPKTEVQMTYNDQFIFIAITCYDSTNHVIQSLKRDEDYWDSDGIGVLIDPVNQKTNGFMFGVNTLGVQMEALISEGGGGDRMNRGWDNKWKAETQQLEDRWTVEMAIPFKTLRYESNKKEWGINFIRNDIKNNRYHTWTEVPLQFPGIDLGYTGLLIWEESPPKVKSNISVIPYTTTSFVRDIEADPLKQWKANAGLDAKVAISSSLNLDLTVNPDFSQVDVDQAVTNLTRFSIFLPERRTFFLENSDIFSGFGIPPIRPFFSRRIGLNEDNEPLPILYGMRLSGNVNKNWRVGAMNMHTKGDAETIGQNFSVASLQRRVFARSTIKAMFQNRQGVDGTEIMKKDYGRNGSLEFSYNSKDGKWGSWASYHHSWKDSYNNENSFYNTGINYNGKNFEIITDVLQIGTNYFADMGFLRRIENYDSVRDTTIRLGFKQWWVNTDYRIFTPNHNFTNQHNISGENFIVWNPDGSFNERETQLGYNIRFKNRSSFSVNFSNREFELLFPFSFFDESDPFPTERYQFNHGRVSYESDERKLFVYEVELRHGGFYNGTLTSYILNMDYRIQPWGKLGLELEQNRLRFPDNYGEEDLFLINSKVSVNFSKRLFWTTYIQLNTQNSDFRVNSRLQWRYKPMSDVFLVYSDNYEGKEFGPTYRAIVLKVNYWLAL